MYFDIFISLYLYFLEYSLTYLEEHFYFHISHFNKNLQCPLVSIYSVSMHIHILISFFHISSHFFTSLSSCLFDCKWDIWFFLLNIFNVGILMNVVSMFYEIMCMVCIDCVDRHHFMVQPGLGGLRGWKLFFLTKQKLMQWM